MFAAGRRQMVVAGPPVVGRPAPIPDQESLHEQPLECRIEGTFLHLEHIIGSREDGVGNRKPMHHAAGRDGLQDQHVECALRDGGAMFRAHDIDILWHQRARRKVGGAPCYKGDSISPSPAR